MRWETQKHEGGQYRIWKMNQLGDLFRELEIRAERGGLSRVKMAEAKSNFVATRKEAA
jgi:hypothetical protein